MAFTVQKLILGQQKLATVTPEDPVQKALDLMIENDYSQLAVIDKEDKVLGLITGDSIVKALDHFGVTVSALKVSAAITKTTEYRLDQDLFEVLDGLRDQYAVLIVDADRRLRAIVTNYDATEYFRRRAEDIMWVEDIETALKEHINAEFADASGQVDEQALATAIGDITDHNKEQRKKFDKAIKQYLQLRENNLDGYDAGLAQKALGAETESKKEPKKLGELTLNEYIQLLLRDTHWEKYRAVFDMDKPAIRKLLEEVRDTRNTLAHFRGEITAKQRDQLKFCAEWLGRHKPTLSFTLPAEFTSWTIQGAKVFHEKSATYETDAHDVEEIAPVDETLSPDDSKYAPLALYLQGLPVHQPRVTLTLDQIEAILGTELPPTARRHRSWWANDSVGHVQSQQWLEVGWRVSDLNLSNNQVTFTRIVEREKDYIHFFAKLLPEVSKQAQLPQRSLSPDGECWHTAVSVPTDGPRVAQLNFSFARNSRFRVELYIDTGNKEKNKQIFDALFAIRYELEKEIGMELAWERIDDKRASRICIYHTGSITDSPQKLAKLHQWAVPTMTTFYRVINPHLSRVLQHLPKP